MLQGRRSCRLMFSVFPECGNKVTRRNSQKDNLWRERDTMKLWLYLCYKWMETHLRVQCFDYRQTNRTRSPPPLIHLFSEEKRRSRSRESCRRPSGADAFSSSYFVDMASVLHVNSQRDRIAAASQLPFIKHFCPH